MSEHEASRTLVKSPPELWAECSDAGSLARHLGEFGEIRITRLEPETSVAWEGERGSGTVQIEPSAWGTRVTLTAEVVAEAALAGEPVADLTGSEEPDAEPASGAGNASVQDEASDGEPATRPAPEGDSGPPAAVPPPVSVTPSVQPRRLLARLRLRFRGAPRSMGAVPVATELVAPEAVAPEAVAPEAVAPEAVASEQPPDPEPVLVQAETITPALDTNAQVAGGFDASAALSAALDSLGQAHHRPFSRA